MGINNRKRRAEKKRKLNKVKNQHAHKNNSKIHVENTFRVHVKENPFVHLTFDERKMMIDELRKNAETDYENTLKELQKFLLQYNPIIILSVLSNYFLMTGVGKDGIETKEKQLTQSEVEIIQTLLLQIDPAELKWELPTHIIQDFIDTLKKLSYSLLHKNMHSTMLDSSDEEIAQIFTRHFIQSHTRTVRNWGDFDQVKIISHEIYKHFDSVLLTQYGFKSSDAIDFFDFLIRRSEAMATERFSMLKTIYQDKTTRELLVQYYQAIQNDPDTIEEAVESFAGRSKKEVFLLLLSHSDLRLPDQYIFTIDEICDKTDLDQKTVENIVNTFSYALGELVDYKTEYIFLANPIWQKPIIKLSEEAFFCPLPQLFFSFILTIFDNLIEKIAAEELSEAKSSYLENKIVEIVQRRFPEQNTIASIKWKEDQVEYETDLITFIGSYALIVEAKSHKITNEALRGAPKRLKKKINEILVEPNVQSERLKNKLLYLINHPEIDDNLRDKLPVDLKTIHKILRVSVSLEYFASLQANVAELKKTNWVSEDYNPCPTMSLADFETMFDIFDHPVQILNYLEQREAIEGKFTYQGDELDLLAVYMENHLNFSNIDPHMPIMISGMSKKIDHYYQSIANGVQVQKPVPKMHLFFENILKQLEERKPYRWLEMGSIIYRLLPSDQSKIVHQINILIKNIEKNWMRKGHKNLLIYTPPLSSEFAFGFVIFNNQNKEKRYDFCEEAAFLSMESYHAKHSLVIGLNIDLPEMSYAIISVYDKPEGETK